MHPAQLEALIVFIQDEIEFAFSVENGGRYGRNGLRDRMRESRNRLITLLTVTPMSAFGLGAEEEENEDASLKELTFTAPGEEAELSSADLEEDDDK